MLGRRRQIVRPECKMGDRVRADFPHQICQTEVASRIIEMRHGKRRADSYPDWNARRSRAPVARGVEPIAPEDDAWDNRNIREPRQSRRAAFRDGAAKDGGGPVTNAALGKNSYDSPRAQPLHPEAKRAVVGSRAIDRESVKGTQPGGTDRVVIEFLSRHPINRASKNDREKHWIEMRDVI